MKRKKKEVFPLTDEELFQLTEKDTGVVLRKHVHQRVKLKYDSLPVNSPKFLTAVAEELNKRTLNYNEAMNDVILRFTNIEIVTPVEANIRRRIFVECFADMFIFKPETNKIMTATVNKTSENHIGCIMYDAFNVSIVRPSNVPHSQWVGRNVKVNDKITFKVQRLDVAEVIPYIIGDLVEISNSSDEGDCLILEKENYNEETKPVPNIFAL